jgi:hypothetical protein
LDLCDCCGGQGFVEYGHPNAPEAERTEKCEHCDGTGFILIDDAEPVDEDWDPYEAAGESRFSLPGGGNSL